MAVPKLRFKEFDGDWTSKQLGKIIGISSASRVFKEQWQDSGVPFFRTSDVVSIFKNKENEKAYISLELFEELAKKSGKIKQGDLLVTGGGSIGIPYLVPNDQPLYFKDADLLWMKSSGIVEGSFLYNFFISPKFREYLKSISHTGTISHFTIEQAKATPFGFPSKEEQTKIASFLSAVDEKISQLTQKHELLSQYKQGMMQKLFSQQLRFKADDGSEFGAWESRSLGEVGENIIGLTYSPTDVTNDGSGILVLRSSNIKNGRLDKSDQVRVNKKIKDKIIVQANDILICTRNGSQRLIGKSVIINDDEEMTFGAFMSVYRSEYNRFIAYLMQTPWFFEQVQMNLGARINQITTGTLNEFTFDFPCLEEQTKIANFLSAIDQKIEVVAQQIEQAKQWKKGLLQQMFV